MTIRFKPIDSVPEEMLREFRLEADAPSDLLRMIGASEVKIGAFEGKELVGFIAAGPFGKLLNVYGMYVKPRLRGQRIGTRMVYRIAGEAKKRHLHGVNLDKMVWSTKWIMDREKKKWDAKGGKAR